ncbi:DUF502 domain-containing protein [Halobacteria archaeon HArc-gm2]|nr:DUF502 domain-containing protein [Halobacteria archaeon HArc-gm2]
MPLGNRLKNSFVAGVLLVAPLVVTLLVGRVVVGWTLGIVDPLVQWTGLAAYVANDRLLAQILAVVLVLVTITVLGALAQWTIGQRIFGGVGRVVNFIPLVDTVYSSVRQVASSLVDRDSRYESVVLVEYPREGVYSIGLVTAESPRAVEAVAGEETYNVFLPNSPNPTGGRLLVVPADQIHEIEMSVQQGMRQIVTTGMGSNGDAGSRPAPTDGRGRLTSER